VPAIFVLLAGLLVGAQQPERIVEIQVHGNALTPDAEIIQLAGVSVGMAVDANTFDEATARLRRTQKFEHVEVLKRFASIADPSQISLIIVVDEGPVTIQDDGNVADGPGRPPRIVRIQRRKGPGLMFSPILQFEDGYGFSYGARVTMPDVAGKGSRLSVPATWGGEKRAAVEFDRPITVGLSRFQAGAGVARRMNPFFLEDDDRAGGWLRGDRDIARWLRLGATGEWQHVSFGDSVDRFFRLGGDVTLDTRVDPMLPRNAVYARASWDRLAFANEHHANRAEIDLRGYAGLVGQNVLIVRGLWSDSDRPLPPYLMPLLGGTRNLRGFRAGSAVGDTLVGASAELRLPITSPLSFGKAGFSAFLDTATVSDKGQRVRDRHFERGGGGGVWLSAAFVRLDVFVAHGLGGSTRAQFATSVLF
jgi:outer membrane protein assembly factor BamA